MTNYMLTQLNAKMAHEERLREAEQFHKLSIWRQGQLQTGWSKRVAGWIDRLKQNRNEAIHSIPPPATTPIAIPITMKPLAQRSPIPLAQRSSINEDEWLQIFSMVKNRKLSVEQAAQLLVAMNG